MERESSVSKKGYRKWWWVIASLVLVVGTVGTVIVAVKKPKTQYSIEDLIVDRELPPPVDYTRTFYRQYFADQTVSMYLDKFRTIARLYEDGSVGWDSKPRLQLLANGEPVQVNGTDNQIVHLRKAHPDTYRLWLAGIGDRWNVINSYYIRATKEFLNLHHPFTNDIISTPNWTGKILGAVRGQAEYAKDIRPCGNECLQ